MTKNNDITLQQLIPEDRKYLMDDESKVGTLNFTAAEKRELLKTINTPGWDLMKKLYVKQRLVQVAVAGINVAQNANDMWFYKGKSAEVDMFVKEIEKQANSLRKEEDAKNVKPL